MNYSCNKVYKSYQIERVGGIMVSIHAFQAWDPGSIPGQRSNSDFFFIIMEKEEVQKLQEDIERLRSHLARVDEEFSLDAKNASERIEELEVALFERDSFIAEIESHRDTDINEQLIVDNQRLKELLEHKDQECSHLLVENGNLHDALNMLQSSIFKDVIMVSLCRGL